MTQESTQDGLRDEILHLTPEGKVQEMAWWEEAKAGPRGKGGRGFPDDRIIPLCDRLNMLDGVCTLQSCAGHAPTESRDWTYPGQLWLWLDEMTFWKFLHTAPSFGEEEGVEDVRVLFNRHNDARATVSIDFRGDDVDDEALGRSTEVIYKHFHRLAASQVREGESDD